MRMLTWVAIQKKRDMYVFLKLGRVWKDVSCRDPVSHLLLKWNENCEHEEGL